MTRKTSAVSLADLIPEIIEDLGISDRLAGANVEQEWRRIVGEKIGRETGRVRFADGRLHVEIRSAAWRQVLHLQREAWRDRLNKGLGSPVVREIIFR